MYGPSMQQVCFQTQSVETVPQYLMCPIEHDVGTCDPWIGGLHAVSRCLRSSFSEDGGRFWCVFIAVRVAGVFLEV